MAHGIHGAGEPRVDRGRPHDRHVGRRRLRRYRGADGDVWIDADEPPGYWSQVRQPLPSLVFLLPLLLGYEFGVVHLGGSSAGDFRTGIDRWLRQAIASAGLGIEHLAPMILVGAMVSWTLLAGPRTWKIRPQWVLGMALESLAFGVALIGLSRVVDRGLTWLEGQPILLASGVGGAEAHDSLADLVGFLGAGVYEEAVFRLALLPLLYGFFRIVQAPDVLAGTLAVTGSALAFSMAHHAGTPGEVFTWYVFLFRWMAGVVFAWVFLVRGFGIAVGTHVAYDVLVGYAGWGG